MVIGTPTVLNLIPGKVFPVVNVNQYDAGYQKTFLLYKGAEPFNIAANMSVTIRGTKGDKNGITDSAASTRGSNLISVTLTEQMTAVAGPNIYELRIVDTNGLLVGTVNFVLMVEPTALGDDTVISDSDLNYAADVLDRLQGVEAFKNQLDDTSDKAGFMGNTEYSEEIFWRNAYGNYYSLSTQPTETSWSEIQGITTTESTVIAAFNSGDYYDRIPTNAGSHADHTCLREFSKSTGEVIREVPDLHLYHANALAYDADNRKIYVACGGKRNSSGSLTNLNTIAIVDYDSMTVEEYKTISEVSSINSVSYNHDSGLMVASGLNCYFLNKESWEIERTLILTDIVTRPVGGVQSIDHDDKFIYVSTYYPNTIIIYTLGGAFVKYYAHNDADQWEQESIAVDGGICYITAHKRYYDRNSTNEVHEDFPTIYCFNLDGANAPRSKYEPVSDEFLLYVNTDTTDTIQDGTSAHPCKTVMEALWIAGQIPNINFQIVVTANSTVKWLRIRDRRIYIKLQGATLATNMLIETSTVYLQNGIIADVSGVVPYPYNADAAPYIRHGSIVYMYQMQAQGEKHIGVFNSKVVAPDITFNNSSGYTWDGNGADIRANVATLRCPKIIVKGSGVSFYQILSDASTDLNGIKTNSVNNELTYSVRLQLTNTQGNTEEFTLAFSSVYGDSTSNQSLFRTTVQSGGNYYYISGAVAFTATTVNVTAKAYLSGTEYPCEVKSFKINVKRFSV